MTAVGVQCRDVRVQFGSGRPVLDQLSIDVREGEIVALLGASGCGKSTLLRVIAGLLKPNSGTVALPSASAEAALELAFVFQEANLLPWRSAIENVVLPVELKGENSSQIRTRAAECLQHVGLKTEDFAKFPNELSGGMRMRVSLARALITDPSLMLLDEPFAALDDILRSRLNELVVQLWCETQRTILFVTHNIAEAVFLSHRIAIMSSGKIARWIEVPWSFPRTASLRNSAEFGQMYVEVSRQLSEASQ